MLRKIATILFLLIATIGLNSAISAQNQSDNCLGIWQGVMDGEPGQGSFFFRLEFANSDSVKITKQYGGANLVEVKPYSVMANVLLIKGEENQLINDFEGAVLSLESEKRIRFERGGKTFFLSKYSHLATIVHLFLVLFVLMLLNELFRRYKWPTILFYFILPFALLPLWTSHGVSYWFKWVKVYSVVFAAIWFTLIRYTKLGTKNYAKFIAAAFLAVNIGEAVMQDFSMGLLANVLNAIAGVFSIITLSGYKKIGPDNTKYKDMVWPEMSVFWIIAYDVWNFTFVYLNFPGSAANQFMVLLACTLPSLFIKKGTWLQARAFTLAAVFMYYFTSPLSIESHILMLPRNEVLMLGAGILSFGLNVAYGGYHFSKKRKK